MKKPTLLFVDDAVNLTRFYQEELEDDGYRIDIANSTRSAAELLDSNTYDVVIVEPMMMEFEEIKEFRQIVNHGTYTHIICNTGNPDLACMCHMWGVGVCVIKSSDISALKEKIEILLKPVGDGKAHGGLMGEKKSVPDITLHGFWRIRREFEKILRGKVKNTSGFLKREIHYGKAYGNSADG